MVSLPGSPLAWSFQSQITLSFVLRCWKGRLITQPTDGFVSFQNVTPNKRQSPGHISHFHFNINKPSGPFPRAGFGYKKGKSKKTLF